MFHLSNRLDSWTLFRKSWWRGQFWFFKQSEACGMFDSFCIYFLIACFRWCSFMGQTESSKRRACPFCYCKNFDYNLLASATGAIRFCSQDNGLSLKIFPVEEPDKWTMKFCVDPWKDFLIMGTYICWLEVPTTWFTAGNHLGNLYISDLNILFKNPVCAPVKICCEKGIEPHDVGVKCIAVSHPLNDNARYLHVFWLLCLLTIVV